MRDGHRPLAKKKIKRSAARGCLPARPGRAQMAPGAASGRGAPPARTAPAAPKTAVWQPNKLAPSVRQGRTPMRAWCPKQGNPPHCARTSAIPLTDTVHNRRTALSLGCSAEHAGKDKQHALPTC